MWAQGLTIGVLLVAGALTHKNRQDAAADSMRRVSECLVSIVSVYSDKVYVVFR